MKKMEAQSTVFIGNQETFLSICNSKGVRDKRERERERERTLDSESVSGNATYKMYGAASRGRS